MVSGTRCKFHETNDGGQFQAMFLHSYFLGNTASYTAELIDLNWEGAVMKRTPKKHNVTDLVKPKQWLFNLRVISHVKMILTFNT